VASNMRKQRPPTTTTHAHTPVLLLQYLERTAGQHETPTPGPRTVCTQHTAVAGSVRQRTGAGLRFESVAGADKPARAHTR